MYRKKPCRCWRIQQGGVQPELSQTTSILSQPGGKGKRMEYKILSKEHRIIAVPMKYNGGFHIIYGPSMNVIMINADCQNLERIADIIEFYLTIEGRDRLGMANCTNDKAFKDVFHVLDQVARIRRQLYKHRSA